MYARGAHVTDMRALYEDPRRLASARPIERAEYAPMPYHIPMSRPTPGALKRSILRDGYARREEVQAHDLQ